jgi:hypothetical protein
MGYRKRTTRALSVLGKRLAVTVTATVYSPRASCSDIESYINVSIWVRMRLRWLDQ